MRMKNARERERESQETESESEKDYSFMAERQRESFSLKAPFCPGAVFRFESNLPCRAPRYTYTYLREFNGPAKKGSGLVTFLG